jgi:uncharacterized protein YndB with AHSA1/START domain
MTTPNNAAKAERSDDRVLIVTRIFDAPRALVFAAWTDPERMQHWMGPRDYPSVHREGEIRPGGSWRCCLRSVKDGHDLWQGGVYKEIVPLERLVFTFAWDKGHESSGHETLVTVTFEEHGSGKTKMTLRQELFESVESRDGHNFGWNSSFDRLADYLQTL